MASCRCGINADCWGWPDRRLLPASAANDMGLMRRLDELFTRWPFLGSRRLARMLRSEGHATNRKRVQRLMRQMGIAALGPKPHTTKPVSGHKVFPYRGDYRLGELGGAELAVQQHHGRLVLHPGVGGGAGA